VAGQNLGAERPDRSARGVHVASIVGLGVAVIAGTAFLTIPRTLIGIFGIQDADTLAIGSGLLRYLSVSGLFVTVALAYTGGLQGTGDTRSPLYISIVSQLIVPLGLCAAIQQFRPLEPGDIWTAIVLGHVTRSVLSVARFRQGRWRSIVVSVQSAP
jgi:Na+-driven multidrug efflux pump